MDAAFPRKQISKLTRTLNSRYLQKNLILSRSKGNHRKNKLQIQFITKVDLFKPLPSRQKCMPTFRSIPIYWIFSISTVLEDAQLPQEYHKEDGTASQKYTLKEQNNHQNQTEICNRCQYYQMRNYTDSFTDQFYQYLTTK